MLRIHVIDEPSSITLKVEGKLIQDWVIEARNAWLKIGEANGSKKTIVDLHDLSFADELGRHLLSEMHNRGAKLVGSGPMVDALIEEITGNGNGNKKRSGKLVKTLVSLLFLLIVRLAFGQEVSSSREVLTLDRAIRVALESNRQVRIAKFQADKSDLQVQLAKIKRLPTLNTEVSASGLLAPISFTFDKGSLGSSAVGPLPAEDTKITNDPTFNLFGSASLSQPLSQLYRIGLGIKANKLSAQVERENLRVQQLDITNKVRATYYEVLRLQSAIVANDVSIKACQELDRLIKTYVAEQTVLRSDALEVRTRLLAEQEKGVSLRHGLQAQKEQMNLLLGRDLTTDFEVMPVNEAEYVEMDLAQSRSRAFEQRPELKQAMLSVHQAEYSRKLKKAEYIPDVTAYVSYVSPFNISFVPKNMATAGIQVKWEPFDWGRKKLELQDRELALNQSEQKLQETRAQIALEVGIKYRKLEESRLHLQVTQLNQETTQEKTRVMVVKYSEHAALLRDVLENQSKLAEANHEYQEALLSFWTAKADFTRAIGEE